MIPAKHGMEEDPIDPLDSAEPYVSPDIIDDTVLKTPQKIATVTEKSKPR